MLDEKELKANAVNLRNDTGRCQMSITPCKPEAQLRVRGILSSQPRSGLNISRANPLINSFNPLRG
jgi:hypothetical protein